MATKVRPKKTINLPGERWKKIELPRPTITMDYYISNKGRLKSKHKETGKDRVLNPSPDKKNYLKSSIKLQGGNYGLYVHMQVARYWSKKKKNCVYYIHKDLDRKNNLPSNVIWVTEDRWREYLRDRAKMIGYVPHKKGGKAKLKKRQVAMIKKYLKNGKMPKSKIAEKYDVSHTQINRIEKGENWADVKPAK